MHPIAARFFRRLENYRKKAGISRYAAMYDVAVHAHVGLSTMEQWYYYGREPAPRNLDAASKALTALHKHAGSGPPPFPKTAAEFDAQMQGPPSRLSREGKRLRRLVQGLLDRDDWKEHAEEANAALDAAFDSRHVTLAEIKNIDGRVPQRQDPSPIQCWMLDRERKLR